MQLWKSRPMFPIYKQKDRNKPGQVITPSLLDKQKSQAAMLDNKYFNP